MFEALNNSQVSSGSFKATAKREGFLFVAFFILFFHDYV